MYARLATYKFTGDPHELARRAEEGILPLYRAQAGFQALSLAADGDEVMSLSVWDSADQIDAVNAIAAGWVKDNFGDQMELRDVRTSEVLLSTTLGVSPKVAV
jgi:hypothetical protein